jgi:transposase InsO family protein
MNVSVCCSNVADQWQIDYNDNRPHNSLNYMAPAAFAAMYLE